MGTTEPNLWGVHKFRCLGLVSWWVLVTAFILVRWSSHYPPLSCMTTNHQSLAKALFLRFLREDNVALAPLQKSKRDELWKSQQQAQGLLHFKVLYFCLCETLPGPGFVHEIRFPYSGRSKVGHRCHCADKNRIFVGDIRSLLFYQCLD